MLKSRSQEPARPGRRIGYWAIFGLLALFIAACGPMAIPSGGATVTELVTPNVETESPAATATESPVETSTPESPTSGEPDTQALRQSLEETIPIRAAGATDGFDGVNIFTVDAPDGSPLWVAHTYGIGVFQPELIKHFVALYDLMDGAWNEVARIELDCPTYVDEAGVNAVDISEDALWLAVDGGAGAHSGCFDLLHWDGATFSTMVQGFNASPGAGEVTDIDGDGQLEVVLNGTEPYVFCYACGVRLYAAQILRWDGSQLTPVSLTLLPESADPTVRDLNNDAVELASADLYHHALPLIEEALTLAPDDPIVYWNAQEIRLFAQNRLTFAVNGAYPILGFVFYGDYAAAVNEMRPFGPSEIFDLESPLIVGTPAENWVAELSQYLVSFADQAIDAQPDLAEAYFLRAWGRFLTDPTDPAVVDDLEQAANLAPDDLLLQESVDYVRDNPLAPAAADFPAQLPDLSAGERIRFAAGASSATTEVTLPEGSTVGYILGIGAGQRLFVTVAGDAAFAVYDPSGQLMEPATADEQGRREYVIPSAGDYTVVLRGRGAVTLTTEIPAE